MRLGSAVGLLRYGGIPGVLAVGDWLKAQEHSDDAEDRCLIARVIGEVAIEQFYHPLIALLSDPSPNVRRAALTAAGQVKHPSLLSLVVCNLSDYPTRSAASEALVAYGKLMLPIVEEALIGDKTSEENTVRLVCAVPAGKGRRGGQVDVPSHRSRFDCGARSNLCGIERMWLSCPGRRTHRRQQRASA